MVGSRRIAVGRRRGVVLGCGWVVDRLYSVNLVLSASAKGQHERPPDHVSGPIYCILVRSCGSSVQVEAE